MRQQLLIHLQKSQDDLADIAFTLNCGREQFSYRMSWIASSISNLVEQIKVSETNTVEKCPIKQRKWSPLLRETYSSVEWKEMLREVQNQFQQGVMLDWSILFKTGEYRRLHLPGYVFEMKKYWFEPIMDKATMKEATHES